MDYDVRVKKSFIETSTGRVIVSDSMIQSYVGNATYRLLYFNAPSLYTKFYDCTSTLWKNTCRTGIGSTVCDLPVYFIDTDYTPKQLKEDIIRIILKQEPHNEYAKKLIGSSVYDPILNMTGWDWLIMIFIVIIVSISVSWLFIVMGRVDTRTFDICKIKAI